MAELRKGGEGLQTVAYTCSYVPEEILLAAGLTPIRMIPEPGPASADAYVHPNTCSYVKSLLAAGLAGAAAGSGAVVFANSCDGMRRLNDLWTEYVPAVPALFLDVPKKKDAASVEFFAAELRRLAAALEETLTGARVTGEGLEEAIAACNRVRLLMDEVFSHQRGVNTGVTGRSVLELCLEGARTHPVEFARRLEEYLAGAPRRGETGREERRIVLTANVVDRPDLVSVIEELGGRVVVLDSCIGARHYERLVRSRTGDPFRALAERYLEKASCARLEGIEERFQRLKRLAVDSDADGILYSTMKFCDAYLYEAPLLRMTSEDAGISFLFLENDYAGSGLEQVRTRVEAFLAVAGERRSG